MFSIIVYNIIRGENNSKKSRSLFLKNQKNQQKKSFFSPSLLRPRSYILDWFHFATVALRPINGGVHTSKNVWHKKIVLLILSNNCSHWCLKTKFLFEWMRFCNATTSTSECNGLRCLHDKKWLRFAVFTVAKSSLHYATQNWS